MCHIFKLNYGTLLEHIDNMERIIQNTPGSEFQPHNVKIIYTFISSLRKKH